MYRVNNQASKQPYLHTDTINREAARLKSKIYFIFLVAHSYSPLKLAKKMKVNLKFTHCEDQFATFNFQSISTVFGDLCSTDIVSTTEKAFFLKINLGICITKYALHYISHLPKLICAKWITI